MQSVKENNISNAEAVTATVGTTTAVTATTTTTNSATTAISTPITTVSDQKRHLPDWMVGAASRQKSSHKLNDISKENVEISSKSKGENILGRVPETRLKSKYEIFKDALIESAREVIPVKEQRKGQKWITDDIISLMDEQRKIKEAKEKWLNDKCEIIEKIKNSNTCAMYKNIKEITGKRACTVSRCIKAISG
ncbi:hypothetical protein HELRODRAFT_163006 [Helobdella robusta]|uniref:Uncharacterized protein n=1 Tax=Helobdella robusta TaxID=6412 RepID=T1ETJ8_HELRO|nr:hypothetical protein HELRODRAFT_163006 [Helobdella robusta]ESN99457.1 hypothetical protein HELRODRAFT_163006 [Helobdella robusta]